MTPKPSSKRRQSRGLQEEISKSKPEVRPSQKPEVETKSEETLKNILLSQDSDIQEGHILLRIPSQQSLDDKPPEGDRKPDRKETKKRRMTPKSEWESYHLLKMEKTSLGKLSFVEDEEKSKVQKGNFHKKLP